MQEDEFKYFISFIVHKWKGNDFYNEEIICKSIESKDDVKSIETKLEQIYFTDKHEAEYVTILNYRMF